VILVDTGVWSRHFRRGDAVLVDLLRERRVACHPWIVGELALGPGLVLDVLRDLERLPAAPVVPDAELLRFIELHRLRGIGYVDAQLLASALSTSSLLWTTDVALREAAGRFSLAMPEPPA
jgi:predicted nucleic acid-binding protein